MRGIGRVKGFEGLLAAIQRVKISDLAFMGGGSPPIFMSLKTKGGMACVIYIQIVLDIGSKYKGIG